MDTLIITATGTTAVAAGTSTDGVSTQERKKERKRETRKCWLNNK